MNVGILGGTRFIGFHLAQALLKKGDSVSIFHRGKTPEPENFSGKVNRFHGDRDKPESLELFFQRDYDAVIDLTGFTPLHVEPILSRWRRKIGRYIFCSTTSVYRTPPPFLFDEQAPRAFQPGTYGGDKALVEEMLLAQSELPATIFRPQGVFGPFDAAHALYVFRRLRAGEPVLIRPECAGKKLNFIWVHDLVDCFIRAIGDSRTFGRAFNAAGPETQTPESFILLLKKIAGVKTAHQIVLDEASAKRFPQLGLPWMPHDLAAGSQKLEELGGTLTPLEESLKKTWEWANEKPKRLRLKRLRREFFWRLYDSLRRAMRH